MIRLPYPLPPAESLGEAILLLIAYLICILMAIWIVNYINE